MEPFSLLEEVYYRCHNNQNRLFTEMSLLYNSIDGEKVSKIYEDIEENNLREQTEKKFLQYFHFVAERVPAYKDFLKKNQINHDTITTATDFEKVPYIDKKNYLQQYPLNALCVDGKIQQSQIISVSSGSTGKPHFWPRGTLQEIETAITFETAFHSILDMDKNKKTLLIQCFAMGMYIGGVFTINAGMRIASKGYKLILTTPGNHKEEILRILKELRPEFDQIIIAGYSPLLKDVVDMATAEGFSFAETDIKFMFSGELISESWREMMRKMVGSKNLYTFAFNAYGTADAALLAHETPASIFLKNLFLKDSELSRSFVPYERDFTLAQYNPYLRYFERVGEELVFSSMAATPLIRYNIHDIGGVYSFGRMSSDLKNYNFELASKVYDLSGKKVWKLPFVYILGRSDLTIVLHGANIYPENVKIALETTELQEFASGKFVMQKLEDENLNPIFDLRVELKQNILPNDDLRNKFRAIIMTTLRKVNREYNVISVYGEDVVGPRVTLYNYGDETYFGNDIKQRWVPRKT